MIKKIQTIQVLSKSAKPICLGLLLCLCILLLPFKPLSAQILGAQIQGAGDNEQMYSGVVYGPIDQNDTLWRVASRYKQDSQFTIYQTMLAIYQLNPQAFENANFNTMVNGATLRLPSDRYIARIDPTVARNKAEQDDLSFGRPNSVRENVARAQQNDPNIKPDVPLVNQEDLSKTQAQLQSQLNALKNQQQQQFQLLKQQVSASINSVEALLEENKKLNDQLLVIEENNRKLTSAVETELQSQIDQQLEQLSELITLVKSSEQKRIDEKSKSVMQILSSPIAIIIMMATVTLLLLVGLALVLLRKVQPSDGALMAKSNKTTQNDIVDDELVIGEADDEINQDSDDLLAALSEDSDLDEDDILSEELEDEEAIANLDEDALSDALGDDFDDMLVPDADDSVQSTEDSLDSLDDDESISLDNEEGISLDDEEGISLDDEQAISLDGDDAPSATTDMAEGKNKSDDKTDVENDNNTDIDNIPPTDEEIDEDDGTPEGIDLDANGEINESTIDQIGMQIEDKDQTITQIADEIIDELDNVPSDSEDIDALLSAESAEEPELEEFEEQVSETEVAASGASSENTESTESEEFDAESIMQEFEGEQDSGFEQALDDNELDALLEETNATLEQASQEPDTDSDIKAEDEVLDIDEILQESDNESLSDEINDLSEQLLSELSSEEDAADELDALLDDSELLQLDDSEAPDLKVDDLKVDDLSLDDTPKENKAPEADNGSNNVEESADDISLDLNADDADIEKMVEAELEDEQVAALANDLLQELESENQESDELDQLLDEIEDDLSPLMEDSESSTKLDADELLDDIPSFTSASFDEDADAEEKDADIVETTNSKDAIEDNSDSKDSSFEQEQSKTEAQAQAQEDHQVEQEHPEEPVELSISESDEDVLSSLPDLDNWLDEETDDEEEGATQLASDLEKLSSEGDDLDLSALNIDLEDIDNLASDGPEDELDLMAKLDDSSFDEMLSELDKDLDNNLDNNLEGKSDNSKASPNILDEAGLDLDALMDAENDNDFVDVDDLLKESESGPVMSDEDLSLDLSSSMLAGDGFDNINSEALGPEQEQASNLDLAQVYIDMDDKQAAQEVLQEVLEKGSAEQQKEARELLESLN